jgi:hypothetical protein
MLKNKIIAYTSSRERLQWKSFFLLGKSFGKKRLQRKARFCKKMLGFSFGFFTKHAQNKFKIIKI